MNVSRIAVVFGMEFRRALQRPSLRILMVVVLLLVGLITVSGLAISSGDTSVDGPKAWITSEFNVALILSVLFPLLYLFFVTIAAGMAIPEDDEANVGPILHATPLTAGEYVLGKFLAIIAAFGLVVAVNVAAMMACNHLIPFSDKGAFGPFALGNYLKPALLFTLPSLVGVAGVAFLIGTATRRPLLVYLFPMVVLLVSVFFLWNWSPSWLDRKVNALLMILDPSGVRWLRGTWFNTDRGVAFYNHEAIRFDLTFWLNRGFWLAVGVGSVLLGWYRFARSLRRTPRVKGTSATTSLAPAPKKSIVRPALNVPVRAPGFLRGLWEVTRMETRILVTHPALYLFVPLILFVAVGQMVLRMGFLEFPLLSTSGSLAVSLWNLLTLSMSLILMFFTVESFERERSAGMSSLFSSTPVPTSSVVFGKVLANSLVGAQVLLLNFLAAWVVLRYENVVGLEVLPFALVWGVLLVPTYFAWCAYVVLLQALFRSRYATYGLALATLAVFGYWHVAGELTWAGNWMLWSALSWSDMGVMELDRVAIVLNRLLVVSVGVLFVVVALRRFPRRDGDAGQVVNRLRWRPVLWEAARLAPFAVVALGLYEALDYAVANGREGEVVQTIQKDYWRKNQKTWRDVPVPALVDVDVRLELDPQRQAFRTEGSYLIKNDRKEPLRRVPLTVGTHFTNLSWTLAGKPFEPENQAGLYVFNLDRPLGPDETVRIGFAFEGQYPFGVSKNRQQAGEFILPSGVVLNSFGVSFVPAVGYVEEIGIDEKNAYEERRYDEDYHLQELPPLWGSATPFTVRLEVTGPAEYTYNGVGQRIKDVVEEDRRTTVWQSDHPVRMFNVVAGRWATAKGKGVTVNYHAGHRYNVAEITRALEAAREHYSEWYGPYPWKELKLSQFPALAGYAQGFATNIVFTEGMMLSKDTGGDGAFAITAHEAAHQWWGNMVTPGKGPGANILSEGMANYSTMLLLEKVKGPKNRLVFCKQLESSYAKGRRFDAELPLVKVHGRKTGDYVVTYDKGSWAFWMLDDHLGRDRMLAGLRKFMARYRFNRDHPMIEDLLDVLSEQAQDKEAFKRLTKQLFFEVRLPEYRLEEVTRTAEGDHYVVRGTVKNQGTGSFTVVVAAVKGARFKKDGSPNPDYREERVKVVVESSGSRTFEIKAPFTPDRVVVDPDVRVFQLSRTQAEHQF